MKPQAERRASPESEIRQDRHDSGRVVHITAQDGLKLAVRIFGDDRSGRLPVICLPGLSRNSKDFIALGAFFAESAKSKRPVFAFDYRGRGQSDPDPDWTRYSPLVEARDVLAVADAMGIHKAIIIGTSRGGIIAMILGALRPALMAGIVLNDIGPVIDGTGLARIKTYLRQAEPIRTLGDAVNRVKTINGPQFKAISEADWVALAKAIYVEDDDGFKPEFDPALLKTLEAIDFSDALPELWPQFDSLRAHPILCIRGENSDVLSEKTVEAMVKRHPMFEAITVNGQGHAPLLRDKPTLERIAAFIQRCELNRPYNPVNSPGR